MADRILILEQDPVDPAVWRYGLADAEGRLPDDAYVLNSDPAANGPLGDDLHEASLWVTAILLVRQAGTRNRIVYDLQPWLCDAPPDPLPRGSQRRWERSTSRKSKGHGETLRERAERDREDRPRAVA